MKRILMMLALAAFLVAALSVSALSAFAAHQSDFNQTKPGAKTTFNGHSDNIREQCQGSGGQGNCTVTKPGNG
jgi:hypothetical protein